MNQRIKEILQNIINLELIDIFYQPTRGILDDNILVLNLGNNKDEIIYSLHVACFARAVQKNKILFTSSDEYFNENFERIVDDKEIDLKNTLIYKNLKILKEQTNAMKIVLATINTVGDIFIQFQNNVRLEIYLDCMFQNYEYYRFLDIKNDQRYVVKFDKGEVLLEN